MENLFMALTNVAVVFPMAYAYKKDDFLTVFVISFTGLMSFVSHLVENHKHGMPGFFHGVTPHCSYMWNRLDVFGCLLIGLRFTYLYYARFGITFRHDIFKYLPILLLNIISEYDKYNVNLKKMYVIMHSSWHILAYVAIQHILTILL